MARKPPTIEPEAVADPAMVVRRVPVDSLHLDPSNVRLHNPRNLDAIKSSLARFGQQKPLVVDADDIVRAGNGTLEAAKALGWSEIDVVRTPLRGVEATAYALSDNRSAELASWDDVALAKTLEAIRSEPDFPIDATGFDDAEVGALLERIAGEHAGDFPGAGDDGDGAAPGALGGGPDTPNASLAERFGVPPFSVLDARQGYWQDRKRAWLSLGIQSELGRGGDLMDLEGPKARQANYERESTYNDRAWIKAKGLSGLAQDAHVTPALEARRARRPTTPGATGGQGPGGRSGEQG